MSDADLIAHDPVTPPADPPPAEPIAEPEPPAAPVDADAAIDAEIESSAIDVDGTDKLVPLSAVTKLRERVKTERTERQKLAERAAKADQLEQQLAQQAPYLQAAQALLAARQAAPQAEPAAPPPDDTEARELAASLDLYKPDGTPDVDKAAKVLALMDKRADSKAEAKIAPVLQHSARQQAAYMLARAKQTALPNGEKPDPAILDELWMHLAQQPNGLNTLSSQDGALILWNQALGLTRAKESRLPPKPQPQTLAEPLYTEKAGGQDAASVKLDAVDLKLAKELGMSQADYAKQAASMPWGKK
jgi:hypothetical protein